MNCENFADMLDNYACLSDEELRELEAHSQQCEACAAELDFMRSILATAKSLPPIEPPSDFLDSVNSRLDEELAAETPIKRFVRRSKPYVSKYGAIAACVAIAAAVSTNAGVLLTRMNNDGDGVISEQKTASSSTETGEKQEAFDLEGNTATELPQLDAAAASTEPAAAQTVIPLPTAGQSNAPSTAKSADTGRRTAAANAPSVASTPTSQSRTTPVSTRVPTAAPQPSASGSNTAPAARETVPSQTQTETVQTAVETKTAEPAASQTVQPSRASDEQPVYEIAERKIDSSSEYAASASEADDIEAGIDAELSDYTIAYLDMNQASTYASLSSTVSVKAKDIDRVKELVDVFVNGVYGNYYMITAQDMDGLLGQFDREGIWYSANITESGDRISFKLITMQMD